MKIQIYVYLIMAVVRGTHYCTVGMADTLLVRTWKTYSTKTFENFWKIYNSLKILKYLQILTTNILVKNLKLFI